MVCQIRCPGREGGRGHLDSTFRGWSSILAARVRLVISRLVLIFALPLDFHGGVRVVRSMYLLAALHGIQASLLLSDSLRKLRSCIFRRLCMVLKLLCWLRIGCASFARLFTASAFGKCWCCT